MKIWLCGITQNEKQNIDEMTKDIYQYFDGLIFVDGGSTDGTLDILNERKGSGKIINRDWSNDHDLQMNLFLRSNIIKNDDWFIIRDSCERLNVEWVKNLKVFIKEFLIKNNINSCVDRDKAFLVKYNDYMFFQGTPHWGLQGMQPNFIDLYKYYQSNQKLFAWEERPIQREHYIDSDMKYYFIYGRSNHCVLHYYDNGKTPERYQQQENIRQQFRAYCQSLGIDFSLNSLIQYWKKEVDETMKTFIDNERLIRRFYRLNILNHTIKDIDGNENWSLK
jgi:glycosyltransferase involved in cell wall biosynthesis